MHHDFALLAVHWLSLFAPHLRCMQELRRLDTGFYFMHGLTPRGPRGPRLALAWLAHVVTNHCTGCELNYALLLHLIMTLLPRRRSVLLAIVAAWLACCLAPDNGESVHIAAPFAAFSAGAMVAHLDLSRAERQCGLLALSTASLATAAAWSGSNEIASIVASLCACVWMVSALQSRNVRCHFPIPTSVMYVFSDWLLSAPWWVRLSMLSYASRRVARVGASCVLVRVAMLDAAVFCTDEYIIWRRQERRPFTTQMESME